MSNYFTTFLLSIIVLTCLLNFLMRLSKTLSRTNMHVGGDMAKTKNTTHNDRLPPFYSMPSDEVVALELIRKARHRKDQRATFVQIGANDGVFGDPLYEPMKPYKDCWIGLLVEPQRELYEKLVTLHQDTDWTFFNGIFAPNCGSDGTIPFCETSTPGKGDWDTQGQTNSLNVAQCNNEKFRIVHHPCVASFEDLIQNHGNPSMVQRVIHAGSLDFLQIDVEGYDYEVMKAIHFETMMPQCIHYEHFHLYDKREEARKFLETKGYTTLDSPMNTLACLVAQGNHSVQTNPT